MSSVTFRDITIRRQDVLRALAEFDAAPGADSISIRKRRQQTICTAQDRAG